MTAAMRPRTALMLAGLVAVLPVSGRLAQAQTPPQTPELPPLQQQWNQDRSSPVQQAPIPPSYTPGGGAAGQPPLPDAGTANQGLPSPGFGATGPGAPDQGQAAPAVAPPATFDRPNIWVPATTAKLQALDKVNAQAANLTIKVGQAATFGSLTITVKSCVVRPPDQPADAAAYLAVTDSHPDSPGFDGWMLADEPAVSMLQHPMYDLRVTGCS